MRPQILRFCAAALLASTAAFAASHRNGPLLLEDQTANLNDFYIFRSWEDGRTDRVVMSMSAQGFQNPDNGPSYYKFSDSVLYRFNINNSRELDGNPDIQIDVRFNTQLRPNQTFLSYFGVIDSIDSPGILLYQTYTVTVRNLRTGRELNYAYDKRGHPLTVAPPNQGPKATPDYEEKLGQPSVFELQNGMRVFAGPRDDAFYFDSGATFDFLNFRAPAPVLSGAADAAPGPAYPKAVDGFAGYNISLIAIEAPVSSLTFDGKVPVSPTDPNAKIAGWAATLRQEVTIRPRHQDPIHVGDWVQVDRVGNPLTVEALIPLPLKDKWNRSAPADDQQFEAYIGDPVFGPLGGDNAGWPFGGRRVGDDVVDIGFRALAGVLVPGFGGAPNNQLGDGVNSNDIPYLDRFPFHAPPHAGFAHSQQDGTNGQGKPTF